MIGKISLIDGADPLLPCEIVLYHHCVCVYVRESRERGEGERERERERVGREIAKLI